MKSLLSIILVFLLAVSLLSNFGCGGGEQEKNQTQQDQATGTGDQPLTAREAFAIAEKVAQDWSSDAALFAIATYPGAPEASGRGNSWKFEFNSTSLKKELEVYIRKGKFLQKMEGKLIHHDVIPDGWIDSPEAVRLASGHCSQKPGETYWFGLSVAKGRPVWRIKCTQDVEKPVLVRLDAITGEEL